MIPFNVKFTGIGSLGGGLMVSALDSRSGGLGLIPGGGHCVVFLGKTYQRTCDGLASHAGGGGSSTPSCFMLQKPDLSARNYEPVWLKGFTFTYILL